MAAPVPTPSGVIKISHHCGPGGFAWMVGYTGAGPSSAALATLAGNAEGAFGAYLAELLSEASAMDQTVCIDLQNPGTPAGVSDTSVDGTRVGTQVPNQVCAILDFAVNRRYRGSRPKAFLPFGVDSDLASTIQWSAAFGASVQAQWASYTGDFTGTEVGTATLTSQVAVSYYSGKHPNPNPNGRLAYLPTPRAEPLVMTVTSKTMRLEVGSQRRRR